MKYSEAYRSTLKPVEVYIDLITYRPLAYPFVLLFKRLHMSPNMVTLLALIGFAFSGISFAVGWNITAAILIFFGTLLDCADGQLARITGKSSKTGALLDYYCDIIGTVFIFTGIVYHQITQSGGYSSIFYALLSLGLSGFNISLYDNLRKRYTDKYIKNKKDIVNGSGFSGLQERLYTFLAPLPRTSLPGKEKNTDEAMSLFFLLKLWSFIAGTAHRDLLIILSILDRVDLLWISCILYFNILMVILSIAQRITVHRWMKAPLRKDKTPLKTPQEKPQD